MANEIVGQLENSSTAYNLTQAALGVTKDSFSHDPLVKSLFSDGIINTKGQDVLAKRGGDTVNFQNWNRFDGDFLGEGEDMYGNAGTQSFGTRSLTVKQTKLSKAVPKKDTMSQLRANASLGGLDDNVSEGLRDVAITRLIYSFFNQACGFNATSITVPDLNRTYTGTSRERVTGNAIPVASSSQFSGIGSLAAGGATSGSITSANTLSIQDFMKAERIIMTSFDNITRWKILQNKGYAARVFVSMAGYHQMMNQSKASGANASFSEEVYARAQTRIDGGTDPMQASGKMIGNYIEYRSAFTPMLSYCVIPDQFLPRAVSSTTAQANTRTAVICGMGAVDYALGSALGTNTASYKIKQDTNYQELNDTDFWGLYIIDAMKRTQIEGTGSNEGTLYDTATYKIEHYSDN
jgi:hypothetical protein